MKIALAQSNYTIGDFDGNKTKIINNINLAKEQGANLVVFSELAISGSHAYDLLNKVTFLDLCEEALVEIASYCDDISVLVGLPVACEGKTISAAALIQDRKIVRYIGKKNVNSRDEINFIAPSKGCEYITVCDHKFAVVVGEDILAEQEFGEYADTVINLAGSSYSRGIIERRYEYYKKLAFTSNKNVVYINSLGGNTDVVGDGSSAAFNKAGNVICLLKSFKEDLQVVDIDNSEAIELPLQNRNANTYCAIKLGLKDYFEKSGFTKACLGLSGGVDSAVVAALATEVLGAENVRVFMMPSQFSSDHSVDDAVKLAEKLGIKYDIVPITPSYRAVLDSLNPVFGEMPFDVTEENIQARIRAVLIMALSNKFNHIVLNTSNKSEGAVGYGTMYGDCIGSFSILGDLYKIEVFELARYINRNGEIIPENTITKAPSAELRPEQVDSDSLPPYDVLDAILYRMIEKKQHREEIINAGFDAQTVYKVYNMIKSNEYKRQQFCPTLRMSSCSFGKGRIMPLTSKYGF
ncbi:MAG: NAD+ synthase [Rikenellaceae bacterium]